MAQQKEERTWKFPSSHHNHLPVKGKFQSKINKERGAHSQPRPPSQQLPFSISQTDMVATPTRRRAPLYQRTKDK
ncbi:hypothetical protein SESBI_09211 [Sesbania bispinosa]|nr:hypothetical protein SESBI_09211 [Sesbania bispinosa]